MLKSKKQLEEELRAARETNRRLNRRCQELESRLAAIESKPGKLIKALKQELERASAYANEVRDASREHTNNIRQYYDKQWQRLPKPEYEHGQLKIDGIKVRVDEALRLINRSPLEKLVEDLRKWCKRSHPT